MAQPIKLGELLTLTSVGVAPQHISFTTISMESEKFICIREKSEPQSNIAVIPLSAPSQLFRKPVNADFAIMHPTLNILALGVTNPADNTAQLQVFNLDQKAKVRDLVLPGGLLYWKWVADNIIALVTPAAVFHWDVSSADAPRKMFDRLPNLSDCQIISYRADETLSWLALVGIAQREGAIVGQIQLHSMEKKVSQVIEGQAASFVKHTVEGASKPSTLFVFAQRLATGAGKMFFLEVLRGQEDKPFARTATDIAFPAEAGPDFPVGVQCSEKYDITYLITKFGFLHVFHTASGSLLYRNKVSNEAIFTTCPHKASEGLLALNKKGQVLTVSINEATLVQYIIQTLGDTNLGLRVASKGLPGADELLESQFRQLLLSGRIKEAAGVAAKCQSEKIRGSGTIQILAQMPAQPGQPAPLLQYFSGLLEVGKLNQYESVELARLVISMGKAALLERWLTEDRLACSEQLGDMLKGVEMKLALAVYNKGNCYAKVVALLAESGQFDKVLAYCQKVGYTADFMQIITSLIPSNPAAARAFALQVIAGPQGRAGLDLNQVVAAFLRFNQIQELTALLLEALKGNQPEDADLQTKLLEVNLSAAPQVADAILGNQMFTHYDKPRIASMCERVGLFQRALEHYTELKDVRRVIVNTQVLTSDFIVEYCARFAVEDVLTLLGDLLRANMRQNLQIVVAVCTKYADRVGADKFITLFEQFKCYDGVFFFLGQLVNISTDPTIHFKYIEAAANIGQIAEVERVCRESDSYDPARVKDFLKEKKLPDQLPLIIVCDRFGFVADLIKYLYQNQLSKFIEVYVQRINPANTHIVVGALLDSGCNEDYIKKLVVLVGNLASAAELIEAFETRNRLKLLLPWLEARLTEGNPDAPVHSAIAKVYVDIGKDPEEFLLNDQYYDSQSVGKYCEDRDPYLAFVAYRRGKCDEALIQVTNKHNLFKNQAQYLVDRMSLELWAQVLNDQNEFKRSVVDQVVQSVLPEIKNPDNVTVAVKAFMNADMPHELIELLDKLVLEGTEFATNTSLQNLLILTAIKADPQRVSSYIERLNNYDVEEVTRNCLEANLLEETFAVFKKAGMRAEAAGVLINNINDLARATEFAEQCNDPAVYSLVGEARLNAHQMKEAIAAFVKAGNTVHYPTVIAQSMECQDFEDLITYLVMCREKDVKDSRVETELLFAYAKTNKLAELEKFITNPNSAQIQVVADRCYDGAMFEAAKILYENISNFVRLASTLLNLKKYPEAVEAARKANSTKSWKEVCIACADCGEFKLAQSCGLNIIVQGDELSDLIKHYETHGYFNEGIQMLEAGLGLDKAHNGMFTELAILYSKHCEEKLMGHIKSYRGRMQLTKVVRVVKDNQQWKELVQLFVAEQPDQALETMIAHGADCWDNSIFKEAITRVTKTDLLYRSVDYYLSEHPKIVGELLTAITPKVDPAVIVERSKRKNLLFLARQFLIDVQGQNISTVNEALNSLYIEEGEHELLSKSIKEHDKFDFAALAAELEKHPNLHFRRIAIALYSDNKKFEKSIELAKKDKIFGDAISSAAASGDSKIAEDLLTFFVQTENKGAFTACLYACNDLLRPDVVMELSWKNKLTDLSMPFMIQTVRAQTTLMGKMEERLKRLEAAEAKRVEAENTELSTPATMPPGGFAAIMPPPAMDMGMQGMQGMQGMGMNMGMQGMGMQGMQGMGMQGMGNAAGGFAGFASF